MSRNGSGKHKVTLAQIADAANVSKATVSLILNGNPAPGRISEPTRAKVMQAAKKMGYSPNAAAKALSTGRSNTILMVVFDLWDENLTERIRGVEAHLVPAGYTTRMCTVDARGGLSAYANILSTGQADGVLLAGVAMPDSYPTLANLSKEARLAGVPIVSLTNTFPAEYAGTVTYIDDESGGYQAVSHLIEHGHRRIAILGVAGHPWAELREMGYLDALKEAGIEPDPKLIIRGGVDQIEAYKSTIELATTTDFTAMFAVTDNLAFAALAAIKKTGRRVPEDCALVGFDNNTKFTRFTDPPLTTIDNPFYNTGMAAAKLLIGLITNQPIEPVLLPVKLVSRRSCGCTCEELDSIS